MIKRVFNIIKCKYVRRTEAMSNVEDKIKECKVEYITPKFNLHKFNAVISDRKIIYQVIKMTDSSLIFINDRDNMQLSTMFMSLTSRYDSLPMCTRLFGGFTEEEVSKGIAGRLCKKLNKTVFVSCNLEDDRTFLPLVEKRIYEEIQDKPEMF